MGEEAKQEEPPKAEEAPPPAKEPEPVAEEKKEEEPPKPPSPLVVSVELHCVGCAKKIEKSLLRTRGVEGVMIDMGKNQVTIKGVVEHQVVCNKILKKTKRSPKILSEGEPIPQVVASQVSGLSTVELNISMHCEACALQLKKKILKMRGAQTVETELSTGKVTVTGTMDGNKLVDYVYKRTKKQARIVPPPLEPEKQEEEEKPPEEAKAAAAEEKKEEDAPPPLSEEEPAKHGETVNSNSTMSTSNDEESMKRMTYYYQPMYVIERIPPAPQLFSDENPNACCIS